MKTDSDRETLQVLNMRASIDPLRHYKALDIKKKKVYQVGIFL